MNSYRENARAYAEGAAAERERIRSIMALTEAEGREGAAMHIALCAAVPIDAIKFILASVPAGPRGTFNMRIPVPDGARVNSNIPLEDLIDAVLR